MMSIRRRSMVKAFLVCIPALLLAVGCAGPSAFCFDVISDNRMYAPPKHVGAAYFEGVCEAIRDTGPGAFMIAIGDIDPPDGTYATVERVLGKPYTWYPVVGNHELEKPEYMNWLRAYNAGGRKLPNIVRAGPPGAVETCYSFDYAHAHFAIINQYYDGQRDDVEGGAVSDALHQWLNDDLAATDKPIVFVVGHEPIIAMPDMNTGRIRHQGDSLDENPKEAHRFWSLLRKHNVVAYLCGHTHNTSIARINGLWQIDSGHARGIGDKGAPSSFVRIRVTGNHVTCDVYRSAQADKEPYRITYSEKLR